MKLHGLIKHPERIRSFFPGILLICCTIIISGCTNKSGKRGGNDRDEENVPVAYRITEAKSSDGHFISWKEHLIDGPDVSGVPLSGGDGLVMADLDMDGHQDILSVHEGDTAADGIPRGYIRLAFGSGDPDTWELVTLAEGPDAGAAEDVAVGDLNGDGWPDVMAACELAHLIYFQNPGKQVRTGSWEKLLLPGTLGRGSFIRVFIADFDNDGRLEVTSPNKGSQHPGLKTSRLHPISWFQVTGDPLDGNSWKEHELTRVDIPENARPYDLDRDGDLDIIGGSRGEERIMWFENIGASPPVFLEHAIRIRKEGKNVPVTGVNIDFHDFNHDGLPDIVIFVSPLKSNFGWIAQPQDPADDWEFTRIGTVSPDHLMGVVLADINDDGHPDVMTGAYSSSPRTKDGDKTVNDVLGRLAWFENPGSTYGPWIRHDFSRRIRGMYDKFIPLDMDHDGDTDFVTTRGNSFPYDGVLWLEQLRSEEPGQRFFPARKSESRPMGLPQ